MNKSISHITTEPSEQYLLTHVLDKLNACINKNYIQTTKFLSENEIRLSIDLLKSYTSSSYILWGGWNNAKRKIIIFLPCYIDKEEFIHNINIQDPLKYLRLKLPKGFTLSHRDYLGSLMSLGIERSVIGDILSYDNGCDIILLENMLSYIQENFTKAGNVSFKSKVLSDYKQLTIPKINILESKFILSSLRLDCYISTVFKTSRSKAQELIKSGLVYINNSVENKPTRIVPLGASVNLRGKGKNIFFEIIGKTQKDNIIINVHIIK